MSAIGRKRTSACALHMSAFDPKRTLVAERPASFFRDGSKSEDHCCCGGVVRAATGTRGPAGLLFSLGSLIAARADGEPDPEKRAGFEALAASYRRMAEQAPHEGDPIIDVELPIEETKPPEK